MWVAILGLVLAFLQGGYQTVVSEWGSGIDKRALTLANNIAKDISSNEALINKLTLAYNQKNNNLINSLFKGAGFGPRAEKLRGLIASTEKEFQNKVNQLNQTNVNLKQTQELANTASMLGGSSIRGNLKGGEVIKKAEELKDSINNSNIQQNINGGMTNV